jgi:hypothetical protein
MNYHQAKAKIDGRESKKLANNTYLLKDSKDDCYNIRLHATIIMKLYKNYTELNNGGYYTRTTKERLNEYLEHGFIRQSKSQWYYLQNRYNENLYFDGIQIDYDGNVLNPVMIDFNKFKQLKKLIKDYINNFEKDIQENGLEYPSGGDCWHCCIFDQNMSNMGHIIEHLKESYFVPSLLFNIIKIRGYVYPEVIFETIKEKRRSCKQELQWFFNKNFNAILNSME